MEAWALVDLVTALDESNSVQVNQGLGTKLAKPFQLTKPPKVKGLYRRRTKSTGNLVDNIHESSSSGGEMDESHDQAHSSVQQTETDDGSFKERTGLKPIPGPSFAVPHPQQGPSINQPFSLVKLATQPLSVAESDSLNETVSPMRPHTRRKRRFKRMAVDPEPVIIQQSLEMEEGSIQQQHPPGFSFSAFASSSIFAKPRQRKAKRKPINVQKVPNVTIGKRKRSVRERSIECELEKISLNSSPDELGDSSARSSVAGCSRDTRNSGHLLSGDSMDMDMKQHEQVSSSSVSGSESDPGFYTYDDGREADDEQSDWYQESGPTWGVPPLAGLSGMGGILRPWWEKQEQLHLRVDPDDAEAEEASNAEDDEKKFQQLLKGSWQHLSDEAKDAYRLRMQKLRDRIPGREIRAGRRHLGAQRGPSFSILTSANEKLSRFLQDPGQSELRLHPMQKSERDQLSHLASLYSLQMLSEGARGLKCPVLKKTCNTMQAVRIDMDRSPSLWTDFKRQRKTPPASVTSESTLDECPIVDDTSIGTKMLKNMGWTPGQGLGPQNQGRTSPIQANIRPKYLGLGHSHGSSHNTAVNSEEAVALP